MLRRPRQLASFALLLIAAALAAACGAEAEAADCLAPQDGALVAVPCVAPAGATVEPTPTPSSDGGGPDVDDPGLQAFLGAACQVCHTIDGIPQANGQIGPNLTGVGAKGVDYIRQSIMDPEAEIITDCPLGPCAAGVMPQNFGTVLTSEQIDAIVAYLGGL